MGFDLQQVAQALRARDFTVTVFSTADEAADYLDRSIDGQSVSFGGSMTLQEMGLYEKLSTHNELYSHWNIPDGMNPDEVRLRAQTSDIYVSSVNGLAATGEIVNIDGTGNRVASTLFGHKKVYFVVGRNKIAADYDAALYRARNIASPKNAARIGVKTPCVVDGRCHDCKSPERICRGLVVLWERMKSCEMEVVLIDAPLGY